MDRLPLDLVVKICASLSHEALLRCALVCRAWHGVFAQSSLYKRLALAVGVSADAAPEQSKEWRRIWCRRLREFVWPQKRTVSDADVSAWLARVTLKNIEKMATKERPWHTRFEVSFIAANSDQTAALLEVCGCIADSPYAIPITPEGAAKGRTQDDLAMLIPRYGQSLNVFRSTIEGDMFGCYDMYEMHGNVVVLIAHMGAQLPKSYEHEEITLAVLELRPSNRTTSHVPTPLRNYAKAHKLMYLSLASPLSQADLVAALEQVVAWDVQKRLRDAHSEKKTAGCAIS